MNVMKNNNKIIQLDEFKKNRINNKHEVADISYSECTLAKYQAIDAMDNTLIHQHIINCIVGGLPLLIGLIYQIIKIIK